MKPRSLERTMQVAVANRRDNQLILSMEPSTDVPTGEVGTAHGAVLTVGALGSCVAVIALDVDTRTGGIAHIMLPGEAPAQAQQPTRYASVGIRKLLDELRSIGARTEALTICLVGGGNVLERDDAEIGAANIESVLEVLGREGLGVCASALGGRIRRSCVLDAENGRVTYTEGDEPSRVLWQGDRIHG